MTLTARAVVASRAGGYHLDSMAVTETTKLVERVLADHRFVLSDPEALDALLNLLDVFADTGWPDAIHLVWRLGDVFR